MNIMNIMAKKKAKLTAPAQKKKMACSFSMASQRQKKVIFHAVVECRISANKMQVHRIPDVGAYFLFIFCLFAVHTPTPCIWVCLKMVYTLQMVIEFGDILSNNT